MIRATIATVRAILPSVTLLTDDQITAAINAANCIVNRIALGCAAGLDEACLTQVEIYLAAHFAAATERTLSVTNETDPCCGGSATYSFKFGEGINGTPFGQMANMLSGGCLMELDKMSANMFSIGCL